jgi:hypothetical protein
MVFESVIKICHKVLDDVFELEWAKRINLAPDITFLCEALALIQSCSEVDCK